MVFLFQHESAHGLDPAHVDEIAALLQQGWSMDHAMVKVGKRKREDVPENYEALEAATEAAYERSRQGQVLCFGQHDMGSCVLSV